jgi:molybdopterin converting factor small subunit
MMKVSIKINGLPEFKKIVGGKKEIEVVVNGTSLRDLVDNLVKKYGRSVEKTLLDENGAIDSDIKVGLNAENILRGNRMETILHDGDILIFMVGGCC